MDTTCVAEAADADDLIWGLKAIAAEIRQTPRQAHYQLEKKLIPGGQIGERWVASRRELRKHFQKITSGRAA